MKPVDEHDLFRLYNASTPSRARFALGMTADQWRAAREPAGWRSREYIYRQDDAAQGWAQVIRKGRSAILTLMSHPNADNAIPALVTHAMSRSWGVGSWYVLRAIIKADCRPSWDSAATGRSLDTLPWPGRSPVL